MLDTAASPRGVRDLGNVVRAALDDAALWGPHARFDPTRRHWALLRADDDVDVWLLTWLRSQTTEPHDHGGSAAAYVVVAGRLREVRADRSGRLTGGDVAAGEVVEVPPGVVHDVRNPYVEPAISIHAYSPPLRRMTYYATGPGGLVPVRSVDGRHPEGAW